MKLSTHHKNKGDVVDFIRLKDKPYVYKDTHDLAYASIILTKNSNNISGDVVLGGTGVSLEINLPEEVEHLFPDYSLYPENEYSIGFLTRGCCRNCEFCVVPKKEGLITFYSHVNEFLNQSLPKIRILDNNLLAYKNWRECLDELKETKKKIKFENFDFRLLTEEMLKKLVELRIDGDFIFALDNPKDIDTYDRKMWMIKKYIHDWRAKFFVLVGYNTTLEEDMARIKFLYNHRVLPYVMRHENYLTSPHKNFYTDLCAFCNQPWFVKKMDFRHFMEVRYKKNHPRIEEESKLFVDLWNKV